MNHHKWWCTRAPASGEPGRAGARQPLPPDRSRVNPSPTSRLWAWVEVDIAWPARLDLDTVAVERGQLADQ